MYFLTPRNCRHFFRDSVRIPRCLNLIRYRLIVEKSFELIIHERLLTSCVLLPPLPPHLSSRPTIFFNDSRTRACNFRDKKLCKIKDSYSELKCTIASFCFTILFDFNLRLYNLLISRLIHSICFAHSIFFNPDFKFSYSFIENLKWPARK